MQQTTNRTALIMLKKAGKQIISPLLSLLLVFLVSSVILLFSGYSPIAAYGAMFRGAFGDIGKIADTLGTATPLILTGLAVAVAMKGGVINIGCEGQLYVGAMAAAVTGIYVEGLPGLLHIPLCLLAAMVAGGLWAALAGWLKVKLQTNEVIVTIMLNYIAIYLTDYLVTYWVKADGMVVKTPNVQNSALLMKLFPHSRLTIGFIIAVAITVFLYWMLKKTVFGFELQAMGFNRAAAETGGVNLGKCFMATMLISGALAGLAGAVEVLGIHKYFIKGFSPGYGYDGLSIAVLGHNSPFGVAISAILFGALRSGATMMDRATNIPGDFVVIMQALIILFVATPRIIKELRRRGIALFTRRKDVKKI
ncbi:MAG: ABC transporter permease [Eubacteriales bacterium]|jgi:ABC-type uncharacterized transport system permease subunit